MRVGCVLVTHLRAKVEMYRHPHLKDVPVVIVDRSTSGTRPLVVDHFPKATDVRAGMTLEQAVSRHSNAMVLDADEPYYRRTFGQMLSALQGVSDRVEGAEMGTAYVRIDGLEGQYGGEARVVSMPPPYREILYEEVLTPGADYIYRPGPIVTPEEHYKAGVRALALVRK